MLVSKFTTPDGAQYFNADWSRPLVEATLRRLPDGTHIEIVPMTQEDYSAIPATNSSARLWDVDPAGTPVHPESGEDRG